VLVWVKYVPGKSRAEQISEAEEWLPLLEADVPSVEELVANAVGSSAPATLIGITIKPDGSAHYDCTFFEGAHEDEFFDVYREPNGRLVFNHT